MSTIHRAVTTEDISVPDIIRELRETPGGFVFHAPNGTTIVISANDWNEIITRAAHP